MVVARYSRVATMRQLLLFFCLSWLAWLPAEASLLDDVQDSLLWGDVAAAPTKTHADTSLSGQPVEGLQEDSPFADSLPLGTESAGQPALLLMPIGQGADAGVGLGLRFSF